MENPKIRKCTRLAGYLASHPKIDLIPSVVGWATYAIQSARCWQSLLNASTEKTASAPSFYVCACENLNKKISFQTNRDAQCRRLSPWCRNDVRSAISRIEVLNYLIYLMRYPGTWVEDSQVNASTHKRNVIQRSSIIIIVLLILKYT